MMLTFLISGGAAFGSHVSRHANAVTVVEQTVMSKFDPDILVGTAVRAGACVKRLRHHCRPQHEHLTHHGVSGAYASNLSACNLVMR